MAERTRRYIEELRATDRLMVRLVTRGYLVTDFSAQYEAFIDGRWQRIIRYDSAHGLPHCHVFRPDGSQHLQNLHSTDFNQALTYAITTIQSNFLRIRESYIILIDQDRRNP